MGVSVPRPLDKNRGKQAVAGSINHLTITLTIINIDCQKGNRKTVEKRRSDGGVSAKAFG